MKKQYFLFSVAIIVLLLLAIIVMPAAAQSAMQKAADQPPKIDFGALIAETGFLSGFIFALVAWVKNLGVQGRALTITAFVVGLIFGGTYRYFVYQPITPLEWFTLVVFGFMGGLIATGAYKGIESATGKQIPIQWSSK